MSYPNPLRWWSQNVLPLVYNGSLSYYEVLCKVVDYINGLTTDMTEVTQQIENIIATLETIDPEEIEGLLEEVDTLSESISGLNSRVVSLESDNVINKNDIAGLKADVDTLEGTVESLSANVENQGERLGLAETQLAQHDQRITNAENTASSASTAAAALGIRVNEAEQKVEDLEDKVDNLEGAIAQSEDWFTATRDYDEHELVFVGGTLYEVIDEINTGDTLTIGENIKAVSVSDNNKEIKDALDTLEQNVGNISNSVNTLEGNVEQNTDDIENLTTDVNNLNEAISSVAPAIYGAASGVVASFDDGASNLPLKELKVNIAPFQSGTGDPSPDNERPITGFTSAVVRRCNKNFIDTSELVGVNAGITYSRNDDGSLRCAGTSTNANTGKNITIRNRPLQNGTYILSGGSENVGVRINTYDKDGGLVARVTSKTTPQIVVIDDRVDRYNLSVGYVANGTTVDDVVYPQLELAESATPYEMHKGDSYEVIFPGEADVIYGGILNVVTGELEVTHKIIHGDSVTWTKDSSGNRYSFPGGSTLKHDQSRNPVVCNRGIYRSSGSDAGTCFIASNGRVYYYPPADIDTLELFNAWLINNPLDFCAEMINHETYQLTPEQINILTFYGKNNVWSDTGSTYLEYPVDTKLYIDSVIAGLQPTTPDNNG